MNRKTVAAYTELAVSTTILLAAGVGPQQGPQVDEPHEEPHPEPLPAQIRGYAAGADETPEPKMHAVNGFMHVSLLGGPERRYYVGRGPDFIAEQLKAAIDAGMQLFEYWDNPGWPDAKKLRIPCALVTGVRVQHLEPDLDGLYEDMTSYVLD